MRSKNVVEVAKQYELVFGSESGKEVMEDLTNAFCNRSSHFRGDPYETAFREGQRDVILRINGMMKISKNPEKYLVAEGEAGNSAGPEPR